MYSWIYFTWPLRKQAAHKQATRGPTALSPFRRTRQKIRTGDLTVESPWSYPLNHDSSSNFWYSWQSEICFLCQSYKIQIWEKTFIYKVALFLRKRSVSKFSWVFIIKTIFASIINSWKSSTNNRNIGINLLSYQWQSSLLQLGY